MKKPYFYFNYQQKRMVTIQRRRERISTASNMAGMLYLGYISYEDAVRELVMRLPGFLEAQRLSSVRAWRLDLITRSERRKRAARIRFFYKITPPHV